MQGWCAPSRPKDTPHARETATGLMVGGGGKGSQLRFQPRVRSRSSARSIAKSIRVRPCGFRVGLVTTCCADPCFRGYLRVEFYRCTKIPAPATRIPMTMGTRTPMPGTIISRR